jgi:tetraacyldisaccharide 4'-kinase
MEKTLMDPSSYYMNLISGQRRGPVSLLLRSALRVLSWPYRGLIAVRNWHHDRLAIRIYLEAPVISVGNLTVGGTGKTPMTVWVCEQLLSRGRKPAVLSRGYKASEQAGADEILLVSKRCPEAVAIAHPDRGASGYLAISEYGAQALVLDDGFQHRRVYRDLDIVLIDATRPFGYGYILPRGLLREPVGSLRRADAVVITRCDQCDSAAIDDLEDTIRRYQPDVPVVRAVHEPAGFTDLRGNPVELSAGSRLGCFCGIARPDAFAETLAGAGYTPVSRLVFDDHHVYDVEDVKAIGEWVRGERLDAVVTTEKDAVKLAELEAQWPVRVVVLRVDMTFPDDAGKALAALIDEMLKEHEDDDDSAEKTGEDRAD